MTPDQLRALLLRAYPLIAVLVCALVLALIGLYSILRQ